MTFLIAVIVSVLATVGAIFFAWRRRQASLPLPAHSGRTVRQAVLACGAGAVVAGLLAVMLFASPRSAAQNIDLGSGASMIVIDLSGSIDQTEMVLIGKTLHALAHNPDRRVGLVFFSDSAVEVLPPQTPAYELEKISRFFEPSKVKSQRSLPPGLQTLQSSNSFEATPPPVTSFTLPTQPNPWQAAFDGGTSITSGLTAARQALEQVHAARHGQIIVISDLEDAAYGLQRAELLKEIKDGIDVKVVWVGMNPTYKNLWLNLFGQQAFISDPQVLARHRPDRLQRVHTAPTDTVAASVLALVAALLLAFRFAPALRSSR